MADGGTCRISVLASFGSTSVTASDADGNPISWSSWNRGNLPGERERSGSGSREAGRRVGEAAARAGFTKAEVSVKGPGRGREAALKGIMDAGVGILYIVDRTPVPHNGCRPVPAGRRRARCAD